MVGVVGGRWAAVVVKLRALKLRAIACSSSSSSSSSGGRWSLPQPVWPAAVVIPIA